MEKLAALLQLLPAMRIGKESVIANAVESRRQDVKQESPDELVCREGHGLLLIVVAVVPPIELHMTVFDIDDPVIGNGDPVRVAANVVHHLLWSGKGWLGVHDPFHVSHRIQVTVESLPVS